MPYGRQLPSVSSPFPTRVSADGQPEYKIGGITLDVSTIASGPVVDTTLPDGSIIKANSGKYLRYGQVLTKITIVGRDTITISGGATGGTFTIPVTIAGGTPVTSAPITYSTSLSAATVQAAIEAMSNVGSGNVTVTGTNGGTSTVEVNTFTPATPTAGDTISVSDANGVLIEIVVGASPSATTITTQLKQAWNASAALTARATASGTATFILTGVTPGVALGLVPAIQGTGTFTLATTGGSLPYTVSFANSLGSGSIGTISAASLTGGTPVVTVATLAPGGDVGMFGPYDSAATDGRATLTRGECYILDELWMQYPSGAHFAASNEITGGVLEGGMVWLSRIIQSGTAGHSLTLGPTKAELLAAFPRLRLVEN